MSLFKGLEKFLFKKVEVWVLALTIFVMTMAAIIFAYIVQGTVQGDPAAGVVGRVAVEVAQSPHIVWKVILQEFLQKKDYLVPLPQKLGGRINTYSKEGRKLGLISFFERDKNGNGEFLLRDIETGKLIEKWEKVPGMPRAISFFDSTIIVAGKQGAQDSTTSLSKVNQDGKIIWKMSISSHHLVYVDKKGRIYTPIIMPENHKMTALLKGGPKYRDDGYAILSPDGHVIQERSITKILMDNHLGYLILGVGPLEWDAIHLNTVKPAEIASKFWKKGDLLLSSRHLSLVMLYRPATNKVIWHHVGPWLNQHDPNFLSDHQISVFGNDVVSSFYDRTSESAYFIDSGDNIYVYDFVTGKITEPYKAITRKIKYRTVTGGRDTIFRDGSLFILYENQGIGLFYDKGQNSIRYFGRTEGDYLNRMNGIDAYPWKRLQEGGPND